MLVASALLILAQFPGQSPEAAAETARWITHTASWGYVTSHNSETGIPSLSASVLSFSDGSDRASTGRLYFYIMKGSMNEGAWDASLTISQAALNHTHSCDVAKVDMEDPRCAKLTLSGKMTALSGDEEARGKAALFARHPHMESWPASHGFRVHELVLSDIWMIDFYGGGANIEPKGYYAAEPKHNVPKWPPVKSSVTNLEASLPSARALAPPEWNHTAARARWLVYHSRWTSVGTVSVRLNGKPWGNVRSMADGVGSHSTGVPVLYIPTPDPTAVDVKANPHVTLSFSEAALAERVTPEGKTCGGMDAEDPTCARLHLYGTLRILTKPTEKAQAIASLCARHPLATWLCTGGAHTGGEYYTIDITSLTFLDYYGGPAHLSIKEYMSQKPVTPP